MKTKKEAREAKSRMITQGKLMLELKEHDGYKLLEGRLKDYREDMKEQILESESFEEFRYKRGYLEGISSLLREVDTIISRGKKQEALLKT